MTLIIIIFGLLTLLAGLVITMNPSVIFDYLRNNLHKTEIYILAVVLRLVIGAFLIYQADFSRYPITIEVIGWLSIVASFVFATIGRHTFIRVMSWALSLSKPYGRIGGFFTAVFGAFLVYAFL